MMRFTIMLISLLIPISSQALPPAVPPAEDPNQIAWDAPTPPAPGFNTAATAMSQILGGTLASVAGASSGFMLGYLVLEPALDWPNGAPFPSAATGVSMMLGGALLTSSLVWLMGKAFGGRSPFLATLGGTLIGSLGYLAHPVAGVALAPIGATTGYHLARKR